MEYFVPLSIYIHEIIFIKRIVKIICSNLETKKYCCKDPNQQWQNFDYLRRQSFWTSPPCIYDFICLVSLSQKYYKLPNHFKPWTSLSQILPTSPVPVLTPLFHASWPLLSKEILQVANHFKSRASLPPNSISLLFPFRLLNLFHASWLFILFVYQVKK